MPPAERPPPASPLAALAFEAALALGVFVVAGVVVTALPGLPGAFGWLAQQVFGPPTVAPAQFRAILAVTLTPLATILAALLHRRISRALDGDAGRGPIPAPVPLLPAAGQVGLHLVLAVLGSYLVAIAMHLLGFPVAEQPLVVEITRGSPLRPEVGVLAVSALLLAPLGEELLFRGQLFRRAAARTGLAPALAVSALLFAAIHMNLQGFVVYAWLALVFARVYAVTGRLGAAVAVHFGNNAVTLAFLLFAPQA